MVSDEQIAQVIAANPDAKAISESTEIMVEALAEIAANRSISPKATAHAALVEASKILGANL